MRIVWRVEVAVKKFGYGLEEALSIVGGKWKVLILWQQSETKCFGELRRSIAGICEKMLIQKMRVLESDGVGTRKDQQEVPPQVEYSLTHFGKPLKSTHSPLCDWGKKYRKRIGELQSVCEKK